MNSERTGSLRGHVCETHRGLRGVFCSQSARRRLRTGRAHVFAWRTPRIARFFFFYNAQGDIMAARVVRDPAGGSVTLPDGAVHKGRGTRQLHDVTGKVHVHGCELPRRSAMCEFPRWMRI